MNCTASGQLLNSGNLDRWWSLFSQLTPTLINVSTARPQATNETKENYLPRVTNAQTIVNSGLYPPRRIKESGRSTLSTQFEKPATKPTTVDCPAQICPQFATLPHKLKR